MVIGFGALVPRAGWLPPWRGGDHDISPFLITTRRSKLPGGPGERGELPADDYHPLDDASNTDFFRARIKSSKKTKRLARNAR